MPAWCLALLLAARWSASLTGTVTPPASFNASVEAAFEPLPWLRVFTLGTAYGHEPRLLGGTEVLAPPLLPVELAVGLAFGGTLVMIGDVEGNIVPTAQVRAFAGCRALDWLTVGLLFAWNAVLVRVPRTWLELGARVAFRW